MPRETVEIAVPADDAHLRADATPKEFNAHLGFLFVVVAPALFWAALTFAACSLAGVSTAPQLGIAVFAVASALLTMITRALRVRL